MTTQRQENIRLIMEEARTEFGSDFNARGLLVGLEVGLEMSVYPPDPDALSNVIEGTRMVRNSRDTELGRSIGRVLGRAHNIGSLQPTTEASHV